MEKTEKGDRRKGLSVKACQMPNAERRDRVVEEKKTEKPKFKKKSFVVFERKKTIAILFNFSSHHLYFAL